MAFKDDAFKGLIFIQLKAEIFIFALVYMQKAILFLSKPSD